MKTTERTTVDGFDGPVIWFGITKEDCKSRRGVLYTEIDVEPGQHYLLWIADEGIDINKLEVLYRNTSRETIKVQTEIHPEINSMYIKVTGQPLATHKVQ